MDNTRLSIFGNLACLDNLIEMLNSVSTLERNPHCSWTQTSILRLLRNRSWNSSSSTTHNKNEKEEKEEDGDEDWNVQEGQLGLLVLILSNAINPPIGYLQTFSAAPVYLARQDRSVQARRCLVPEGRLEKLLELGRQLLFCRMTIRTAKSRSRSILPPSSAPKSAPCAVNMSREHRRV